MPSRPPSALDWFLLFVLAVVWGAGFLFIKKSVAIFSPMQMAMWRMVLATVIYLPVAAIALGAFDGEVIGWLDLVGTGVILAGLYIARK